MLKYNSDALRYAEQDVVMIEQIYKIFNMKKYKNRVIQHIRRWNVWRKRSLNNPIYKLLVLFGIMKSPTFNFCLLPEEVEEILDAFEKNVD